MEDLGLDKVLLFSIIALTLMGLVMVYSSSYRIAMEQVNAGDASFFLRKHMVRVVLGLILLYVFMRSTEGRLRGLARPLMGLSLALLVLVLLPTPLRHEVRGSARWVRLGPLTFQPSDLAKVALVLYIADFTSRKGAEIKTFKRGFVPPFIVTVALAGLIAAEPNIGTAAMVLLVGAIALFAAGARFLHVAGSLSACIAGLLSLMWLTKYNWHRVVTYAGSSPIDVPDYHLRQSLIAIGAGGLKGAGIGMGNQKYLFLPEAHTDFVFAIAAEEIGLIGMLAITGLFFIFVWRGLRTASRAHTVFASVLATGITMTVAAYFCVSAGVCTGLLPTAGLPLPFMSYGGSSSIMLLASCGMLLGLSRRRPSFIEIEPTRWRDLTR